MEDGGGEEIQQAFGGRGGEGGGGEQMVDCDGACAGVRCGGWSFLDFVTQQRAQQFQSWA